MNLNKIKKELEEVVRLKSGPEFERKFHQVGEKLYEEYVAGRLSLAQIETMLLTAKRRAAR